MTTGGLPVTAAFSAGSDTAALSVPTVDDGQHEPDSMVTAAIQPADGYTLGDPSTAEVAVSDNDPAPPAVVTVEAVQPDAGEEEFNSDGTEEPGQARFRLRRAGDASAALTVNVRVRETRSMLAGGQPNRVTFAAGEDTAALNAPLHNDNTFELESVVTVEVLSGTGYAVGSPSTAEVIAWDLDPPPTPTVTIRADLSSVSEGDGTATFTLTRTYLYLSGELLEAALGMALDVNVAVSETGEMLAYEPDWAYFEPEESEATLTLELYGDPAAAPP